MASCGYARVARLIRPDGSRLHHSGSWLRRSARGSGKDLRSLPFDQGRPRNGLGTLVSQRIVHKHKGHLSSEARQERLTALCFACGCRTRQHRQRRKAGPGGKQAKSTCAPRESVSSHIVLHLEMDAAGITRFSGDLGGTHTVRRPSNATSSPGQPLLTAPPRTSKKAGPKVRR